jgi:hypothetical protein
MAPEELTIFEGQATIRDADWGTVEMPMPFFILDPLEVPQPPVVLPGQPPFDHDEHEKFLYDSQCTCIPEYDPSLDLRDCVRIDDCCNQGPDDRCFVDPLDNNKGKCTGCRLIAAYPDPDPWVSSCNEDADCCPTTDYPKPQCVDAGVGVPLCREGRCNACYGKDDNCDVDDGWHCDQGICRKQGLECVE